MLRMSVVLRSAAAAFAVLAAACSSGGGGSSSPNGPVIDDISLPSTFTVSGNSYTVQGTMTYQDDTGTVTQLHEKIPSLSLDSTIPIQGVQGSTSATLELGFTAASPVASGTVVEIDVSVIDDNNVESNVEVEQITVP